MLNEKDCLGDILNQEKDLAKVMASFLTEIESPDLRKAVGKGFDETTEDQYRVFEEMKKRKYYLPKRAKSDEAQEIYHMYKDMLS